MSEKVVLPREVAEAIENVRKRLGWSDEVILYKTYINGWEAEWTEVLNANGDGNKAFLIAKALVNGYEIEQTPEEKLRDYYKHAMTMWQTSENVYVKREGMAKISAIKTTLNILGVTIGGINGKEDDK